MAVDSNNGRCYAWQNREDIGILTKEVCLLQSPVSKIIEAGDTGIFQAAGNKDASLAGLKDTYANLPPCCSMRVITSDAAIIMPGSHRHIRNQEIWGKHI
jgi:hypothetical protein